MGVHVEICGAVYLLNPHDESGRADLPVGLGAQQQVPTAVQTRGISIKNTIG